MTAKKKGEKETPVEERKEKRFVVEEVSSTSASRDEIPSGVEVEKEDKEKETPEKESVESVAKDEVLETKDDSPTEPEVKEQVKSSKDALSSKISVKQVLMIAIPTALMVAALTGGIIYYMTNIKTLETPQATQAPTFSPIPTPEDTTPVLERDILKVQVLNGSGTKGAASVVKDYLEGLGYKDIDTGNAPSYDYDETVLQLKEDRKAYEDILVGDLSKEYKIAKEVDTLDGESDFDAVVIVGKN